MTMAGGGGGGYRKWRIPEVGVTGSGGYRKCDVTYYEWGNTGRGGGGGGGCTGSGGYRTWGIPEV